MQRIRTKDQFFALQCVFACRAAIARLARVDERIDPNFDATWLAFSLLLITSGTFASAIAPSSCNQTQAAPMSLPEDSITVEVIERGSAVHCVSAYDTCAKRSQVNG